MIIWHYAIRDIGAGLSTVLGNIQVVVVPFLAWAILRERIPRSILVALPLVCVGVLFVSGALEDGAYGSNPPRGVAVRYRRRAPLRDVPADPARGQHGPAPPRRRACST